MQLAQSESVGLLFYHAKQKVFILGTWKFVCFISIHIAINGKRPFADGTPRKTAIIKWAAAQFVEMQLSQSESVGLLFLPCQIQSVRPRTMKICVFLSQYIWLLAEEDRLLIGLLGRLQLLNEQRPSLVSPAVVYYFFVLIAKTNERYFYYSVMFCVQYCFCFRPLGIFQSHASWKSLSENSCRV